MPALSLACCYPRKGCWLVVGHPHPLVLAAAVAAVVGVLLSLLVLAAVAVEVMVAGDYGGGWVKETT